MRYLTLIASLGLLAGCGSEKSTVGTSEAGTLPEATAAVPANSASNENFARLIAASGIPERCINLRTWAGERTPRDRADAGFMEFNADRYVNPAPPYIAALANAGFLHFEQDAVTNGNPVRVYRATAGNEGMFLRVPSDDGRNVSVHFCPGKLSVDVVSYTEPAEERGMTEVRYTYRVSDIPAPIQAMMDSGEIPSGPPQFNEIRGTVLVGGEGTATLVKTSNGWEVSAR